jgi:hypothetical protein
MVDGSKLIPVTLVVLAAIVITGTLFYKQEEPAPVAGGGAAAPATPGAGGGVLAGANTFTLVSEEPAVKVTVKLPGAPPGEFRPVTVSMMNIPIKLDVLATGKGAMDNQMAAVSQTWSAQVSATRSDALFLTGTKKTVAEPVKLADGTVARVAYGSSFMAPSLTSVEKLPRELANKGSKAFQVLVTSDKGELFVTVMGPVERGADLEPIAREIAGSMRIEEGRWKPTGQRD